MDSITQIILGVSVAHITLKHVNAKKVALLGAIVATLPDLDIYIAKFFNDPLTEVEMHRGFSHSIVFFIVLSLIITFLIKKYIKEVSPKQLYFSVFLILLTHSLLDIFTTWGTQLFWPLPHKFALKSIFVVDLFYTIPLLMGCVLGLKNNRTSFTYAGLLLSSLYLIWGLGVQNSVKNTVKAQFFGQYPSKNIEITVKPTFSNTFLWNVIVKDNNGFYLTDYSIFDKEVMEFQYFPQNEILISNFKDDNIRRLKQISENQYIITKNKNGLVFNDLRFGLLRKDPDDIQFAFSYQLVPSENGFKVKELPKDKRDGAVLLKNIWERIFNQ